MPNPPNPELAAAGFALAERLLDKSRAQAQMAADLCIALAIRLVTDLSDPTDKRDIARLGASMLEYAKAARCPSEALVAASRSGRLDFPLCCGEARARPALRAACARALGAIDAARAARASPPPQLDPLAPTASMAAPASPAWPPARRKPGSVAS